MVWVSISVDEHEVLGKLETHELVQELISRDDWQSELRQELNNQRMPNGGIPAGDMLEELIERARLGLPVQEEFIRIAQHHYGVFLGSMSVNLPH